MFGGEWFLAGNQGNHQNFNASLIPKKLWPIFMGIDSCKGQWWSSTYIFMRLSDINSKTTDKKRIFCLFLSLHRTVSQPYRLSHINALRINQSYWPKDQSTKFSQIVFENWRFWKTHFFLSLQFWICFSKKIIFCLIPMKIGQSFLGIKDGAKFWWLPWFPAKSHSPQTFQPAV